MRVGFRAMRGAFRAMPAPFRCFSGSGTRGRAPCTAEAEGRSTRSFVIDEPCEDRFALRHHQGGPMHHWPAYIRALTYPIIFDPTPLESVGRALRLVVGTASGS